MQTVIVVKRNDYVACVLGTAEKAHCVKLPVGLAEKIIARPKSGMHFDYITKPVGVGPCIWDWDEMKVE